MSLARLRLNDATVAVAFLFTVTGMVVFLLGQLVKRSLVSPALEHQEAVEELGLTEVYGS
tara:strand:+ start:838 stop:1017 length:180 start_codon:yes stop_codon:yes gene_type:complete